MAKSALEAIDEALGLEIPADDSTDETLDSVADDSAADPSDADENVADENADALEKAEGDETADPDAPADGTEGAKGERARDPTGKFVKKDEEVAADPAKSADGKDPAAAATNPKLEKALNDAIPTNVAKSTQDRIRTLVEATKNLTGERDSHVQVAEKAKQDLNYMIDGVKATGASPEQYGEALQFLSMFNSSDRGQREKALEQIEGLAERLAMFLGVERKSSDPLAKHPDLQQAVQQGQITLALAKQMAQQKNANALRQEVDTSAMQQRQSQDQQQQAVTQGRNQLTALGQRLEAQFPAKYAALREQLVNTMKPAFQHMPPAQWAGAFEQAFNSVKWAPPARAAAGVPRNQPLRARTQASGGKAAPKNGLDVLNSALEEMGNR